MHQIKDGCLHVFFSPVSRWDFVLCRYTVAESDCNLAIALDSNYFKAYARRGAARFALKKYESALEGDKLFKGLDHLSNVRAVRWQYESYLWTDYEMVLKLDPGNLEAQNEMKKIKEVNVKWSLCRYTHFSSRPPFISSLSLAGFRASDMKPRPPRVKKPRNHRRLPQWTPGSRDWWRSSRDDRRRLYRKTE